MEGLPLPNQTTSICVGKSSQLDALHVIQRIVESGACYGVPLALKLLLSLVNLLKKQLRRSVTA